MFGNEINDPFNTMGADVTPRGSTRPIRAAKVNALLTAKKAYDTNPTKANSDALLDLERDATGYEINEAMDRSGQGTKSWSAVGR